MTAPAPRAARPKGFFGRRRGGRRSACRRSRWRRASALPHRPRGSPRPPICATCFSVPVSSMFAWKSASAAANICFTRPRPTRRRLYRRRAFRQRHGQADDGGSSETPRANLRVYDDDAIRVLLDWLPAACLDRVDLFYPDPWPKKKHWKRRFVSRAQSRPLCPRAEDRRHVPLRLRHRHLRQLDAAALPGAWRISNGRRGRPPTGTGLFEGWPGTRYEAKALREGGGRSI